MKARSPGCGKRIPQTLHLFERRQIHRIGFAPLHPAVGKGWLIRRVEPLHPFAGVAKSSDRRGVGSD